MFKHSTFPKPIFPSFFVNRWSILWWGQTVCSKRLCTERVLQHQVQHLFKLDVSSLEQISSRNLKEELLLSRQGMRRWGRASISFLICSCKRLDLEVLHQAQLLLRQCNLVQAARNMPLYLSCRIPALLILPMTKYLLKFLRASFLTSLVLPVCYLEVDEKILSPTVEPSPPHALCARQICFP